MEFFKIEVTPIKQITKETADAAINELTSFNVNLEASAEDIADKFKREFSVGDYGSGRTYYPAGTTEESRWNDYSDRTSYGEDGLNEVGFWVSSSETC